MKTKGKKNKQTPKIQKEKNKNKKEKMKEERITQDDLINSVDLSRVLT